MLLKEHFKFLPKSKIKAGEAIDSGMYPFFTSSDIKVKRINEFIYDDELIILGTGGVPSCNYYNGKFAVSTDNFVLKTLGNVKPKFLYYFLRSNNLSILKKGFKGSGLQHISKTYVENIKIPVPNLNIQEEVINNLDRINSSIDMCKKHLINLDELIKSRFNEMFSVALEDSNRICKFEEILNGIIGLTYSPENITDIGTIVLRSGNIKNGQLQIVNDVVRVNNIQIPSNKLVNDLDILMCSRNGSSRLVGKTCLIRNPIENMSFGAFMTVIRTKYPYIVNYYMNSEYFRRQLTTTQTSSVNQITNTMLKNYQIFRPSIVEESKFRKFVEQVDKLKFNIQKRIDLYQELLDKKMDEYFG